MLTHSSSNQVVLITVKQQGLMGKMLTRSSPHFLVYEKHFHIPDVIPEINRSLLFNQLCIYRKKINCRKEQSILMCFCCHVALFTVTLNNHTNMLA